MVAERKQPERKSETDPIRRRQGRKIRSYRKAFDLSQDALAQKLGVTKQAVSEWEKGVCSPRQHMQIEIARAFNAPWSVLFGLDEEAA